MCVGWLVLHCWLVNRESAVYYGGCVCCSQEKKVIDQLRRSWQTLRTLLGVARSGHHSGSNRNSNNIRTTTSGTIATSNRKQEEEEAAVLVAGEEEAIRMGRNRMGLLLGPSRSGMVLAAAELTTTVTATTMLQTIATTTIATIRNSRMQTLTQMPTTPTTKSAIGSASRTRIASRRIRYAVGVPSRKAFATTGAVGRDPRGRPSSCLETMAIGEEMSKMSPASRNWPPAASPRTSRSSW